MIGSLPKSLVVDGISREIRTDYRNILLIFEANDDPELSDYDKGKIMLDILYKEPVYTEDAQEKANWFLCGGDSPQYREVQKPVFSWKQDEQMIFSAVNSVAGTEVRAVDYMHWWTFLSLFCGIGESTFSTIVSIRDKMNHGKPLEKWEKDYVRKNASIVKLHTALSAEEEAEIKRLNEIFK